MRALIQRVSRASVTVDGKIVGSVGRGLLVLLGVRKGDGAEQAHWMAAKVAALRIFADEAGKLNKSVIDIGGEVLAVSQFTLYADASSGNRPGFSDGAPGEAAKPIYEVFCAELEAKLGKPVARGVFGADMQVELVNDGPVTIWLEK
ncbi:MAG: D-tyrosyl-tRNA(Tyr) deacylase [Planctomycetes bacterium]|nr:D-tyrosyl-tRNA(Tyr) deacylase [Planctomycetota bacterium]